MPRTRGDGVHTSTVVLRIRLEGEHFEASCSIDDGEFSRGIRTDGDSKVLDRLAGSNWLHDPEQRIELSKALGGWLLPGLVGTTIQKHLADLGTRGARLRIWLDLEESLRSIPWEMAASTLDGIATPLVDWPNTTVYRCIDQERLPDEPLPLTQVMVLRGHGIEFSSGDREWLSSHGTRTTSTGEDFRQALGSGGLVAYVGHCEESRGGLLIQFTSPDGQIRPYGPRDVDASSVSILLLAACSSAETSAGTSAVGQGWISSGATVFIGMQAPITSDAAVRFVRAFVEELEHHQLLDDAVRAGRLAIRDAAHATGAFSAVPVVYTRRAAAEIKVTITAKGERGDGPRVSLSPSIPEPRVLVDLPGRDPLSTRVWPATGQPPLSPMLGPSVVLGASERDVLHCDPKLAADSPSVRQLLGLPPVDDGNGRAVETGFARRGRRGYRLEAQRIEGDLDLAVYELRQQVAELVDAATLQFTTALTAAPSPIPLSGYEVFAIGPAPTLDERFSVAIDATDEVIRSSPRTARERRMKRLLGTIGIRSRLLQLRAALAQGQLCGAQIAWLDDLLWHVLIFDATSYPTLPELSMQVSLLLGGLGPLRRLEPSASIRLPVAEEDAEEESTAGAVLAASLEFALGDRAFSAGTEDPRARFLDVLARYLQAYAASLGSSSRRMQLKRRPAAPLAISMSYDLELERALLRTGQPFHVALPVYVATNHQSPQVLWVVGTFGGPEGDDVATPWPDPGWQLLSQRFTNSRTPDLLGPLVIKVDGSPLHHLDGVEEAIPVRQGVAAKVTHAVAFNEFDALQLARHNEWSFDRLSFLGRDDEIVSFESGLPRNVLRQMTDPEVSRHWLLVGHRFGDWVTRARLSGLLSRVPELRGIAVALHFDPDRTHFVDWGNLDFAVGDLASLAETLAEIAFPGTP